MHEVHWLRPPQNFPPLGTQYRSTLWPSAHLMLMLALARDEKIAAETPFLLAICCPTAASTQQLSMLSTWCIRLVLMASRNLKEYFDR